MVAPRSLIGAVVVLCVVAACGSQPSAAVSETSPLDAGTSDAPADAPAAAREILPYPPGPYGSSPGDVLADFHVQGYALSRTQRDSTKLAFRDITIGEVRSDPACTCLLVSWNAAGIGCPFCVEASAAIASAVANDPSLCALEVVHFSYDNFEIGKPNQVPTRADLDAFTQSGRQPFPVGLITKSAARALAGESLPNIPDTYVVRPSDMRILGVLVGRTNALGADARATCASPQTFVETLATGLAPRHVAVDATHAYVSDASKGMVRVPLAGGPPDIVDGATDADEIRLSGGWIYWSTRGAAPPYALLRTPADGGQPQVLATSSAEYAGLAAAGGDVYFARKDGVIGAVGIGGGPERILFAGEASPTSIAVDGSRLFWVNESTGEVLGGGTDGSGRKVVAAPSDLPDGGKAEAVLLRGTELFVPSRSTAVGSSISVLGVDGGTPRTVTKTWLSRAFALDPTAAFIYLTNDYGEAAHVTGLEVVGRVRAAEDPDRSNAPVNVTPGQYRVRSVAADGAGYAYWTTTPMGGDPAGGTLRRRKMR